MTAKITERMTAFDDVPTRTLDVAGDGPPILLLHGFTDSADSWRPVLEQLAGRARRAIAVDLPGSGRAAPLGRPALAALDRFTAAFLRAGAAEGRVILAGNSLGGLLALRAAQRGDLPLLAVAGLGPAGLAYHRRLVTVERWARRLDPILRIPEHLPVPRSVIRWQAARFYHWRLAERRADPSLARLYASHVRGVRDLSRIRSDLLALSADSRADPLVLDEIRVPVLLIWGARDRLASLEGAPALLDAVPASRLVVFGDCGHCPQVQNPAEVGRLLADLPASAHRGRRTGTQADPQDVKP